MYSIIFCSESNSGLTPDKGIYYRGALRGIFIVRVYYGRKEKEEIRGDSVNPPFASDFYSKINKTVPVETVFVKVTQNELPAIF